MNPTSKFTHEPWKAGVIGLGYVGLPLAVNAVQHGVPCVGYDLNLSKVSLLRSGESDVADISSDALERALESGLTVTADASELSDCDAFFICVPSPLGRNREPDLSFIEAAAKTVASQARPGSLVVLESTSYPGTTEEYVVAPLTTKGFTLDRDIFVAFSPERVDPGQATPISEIPKVVGGVSKMSGTAATAAYRRMFDEVHVVSSARVAEMTKLLENTYRSVNIALANEMALLGRALNIDIWEVIDAASTKPFGFQAFYPGPGVGGHCIPLDPQYLAWKAKEAGLASRFIDLADAVNLGMPDYIVGRISEILNDLSLSIKGSRILSVGITYKRNVADERESPAVAVLERLRAKGAELSILDPVAEPTAVSRQGFKLVDEKELDLALFDLVVILTDHDRIDYATLATKASSIFDSRGAFRRRGITASCIVTL